MKLRDIGLTLTICGLAVAYLTYGQASAVNWFCSMAAGGAIVCGVTALSVVVKGVHE